MGDKGGKKDKNKSQKQKKVKQDQKTKKKLENQEKNIPPQAFFGLYFATKIYWMCGQERAASATSYTV